MAKHKMTEMHYTVLMMAQDGETDFGPNSDSGEKLHAVALELLGYKFGEQMMEGVNSFTVAGLTRAGAAALAKHLAEKS